MPELPEVYTISKVLDKNIKGFKISGVEVRKEFKVQPSPIVFKESLENRTINKVSNHAKNIVFTLDNQTNIVVHLAMTGQLLFKKTNTKPSKWERIVFNLTKNGKSLDLTYNDMRMFGKVSVKTDKELDNYKQKYGINPLDSNISTEKFDQMVRSKRTNIKNVLLDQKIVAGVGNIYANDALFLAGIAPQRRTAEISEEESQILLEALRKVLNEGIEHRGSTLDDEMYVDPFGRKGTHQKYFRIYGKRTCPDCKNQVKYEKLNGRGTYYCNVCQN